MIYKYILLYTGAIFHIGIAAFHLTFWKKFKWETELNKLNIVNKSAMQIFNIQMIFVFLGFSYIAWKHPTELISTPLGITFTQGLVIFWIVRLLQQVYFFGTSCNSLIGLICCAFGAIVHQAVLL